MIEGVLVEQFKCFQHLKLPLRKLTALTGTNGAGKSTVIQSLLLARQASEDDRSDVVELNGPYGLEIGEADDALSASAEDQRIRITISSEKQNFEYEFQAPLQQRSLHLPIVRRPDLPPASLGMTGISFSYLSADRLGPRDQLSVTSASPSNIGVGERGQYVAQALTLRERELVVPSLLHPSTTVPTLRAQTEAWISDIVRPVRIDSHWPPGMTASMIRFQSPAMASQPVRPGNMGFGVSYVLPIVVAALAVGAGILIVENPEAHLHPAGQSKLGRFLGLVAGGPAQVVVETHSDHVLNGIRRAAADDKVISPEQVIIHYFDGGDASPHPIRLGPSGEISDWPSGFFDQFDEDLGRLARAKREARRSGTGTAR